MELLVLYGGIVLLLIAVVFVCVYLVVFYDKHNLTEVETPDIIDLITNTVEETPDPNHELTSQDI